MSVPVFVSGAAKQGAPSSSLTVNAASWRGTSMIQKAFSTLENQTFQGRGHGRFSLIDGKGPRIGASKGTIDTEFRMGSGASTVVLVQSSYSSTTAPLITLGVNSSGQAVGSLQDVTGATVAAWAATSMGIISRTVNVRMQVAWDCSAEIEGGLHVWVIVNGVLMPHSSFTTAPISNWSPFQPLYVTTGLYCETAFDGEMLFTQASATAPALAPIVYRPVEVDGANLTLPQPDVALSGAITPAVTLTGTLTLPSLRLTGTETPTVGNLVGTPTLPSLQLSGTLTVSLSPVSAWLRVVNGTVTGSGYSSIPDLLGGTSPAVQGTDANRPLSATSTNGLPIMTFGGTRFLNWPLSAANNGATKNGIACWCRVTLGGFQNLFVIWLGGGGATANKVDYFLSSANLQYLAEVGGQATKSSFMSSNTWHFVTAEYDGTQATDQARCIVTVDGIVLASTNTSIPTSQPTPTGNAWIGGFGNTQQWQGDVGPNFYALNRQLTSAERTALMNFEAPI